MTKTHWNSLDSWDTIDTVIVNAAPPGAQPNGPRNVHWDVPDFTARVHRGMDLLDEIAHGWPDEIDVDILDLDDGSKCILGQTWPHYARLLGFVCGDRIAPPRFDQMAAQLMAGGDYADQVNYAASIGCALGDDDIALINSQAKTYVTWKLGRPVANTPDGNRMMTEVAAELYTSQYELLTQTWIREIAAARANGRWVQRLILPAEVTAPAPARELLHV